MRARAAALALLLCAVAASAVWVAGRLARGGHPDELRMALVWALPGVVFLSGHVLLRRREAQPSLGATPRALPWIGVALALDLAPLGLALGLGWITLTYGDHTLAAPRGRTALWALPLLLFVGVRFWERTLRARLLEAASSGFGERAGWVMAITCGTLLALPGIAPGLDAPERPFFLAALATAAAREIACTALYRGGGLVSAGLYRGVLAYIDGYLIHDWLSPVFPSANYVTSTDAFYVLRAAGPVAAATLLLVALRRRRAAA